MELSYNEFSTKVSKVGKIQIQSTLNFSRSNALDIDRHFVVDEQRDCCENYTGIGRKMRPTK